MLHATWSHQLVHPQSPAVWIWHGLLAPGRMTLLTGEHHVGKSRFVRALLGHRRSGQPFLGPSMTAGTTMVASTEPAPLWHWRLKNAPLGGSAMFLLEPFRGLPSEAEFET